MRVSSFKYAVELHYSVPGHEGLFSCLTSPVLPAFIPDNSIIHCVCSPFFVERMPCPDGQQPFALDSEEEFPLWLRHLV